MSIFVKFTRILTQYTRHDSVLTGEDTMFCTNCGKQILPGQIYCPHCGNMIRGNVQGKGLQGNENAGENAAYSQPKGTNPGAAQGHAGSIGQGTVQGHAGSIGQGTVQGHTGSIGPGAAYGQPGGMGPGAAQGRPGGMAQGISQGLSGSAGQGPASGMTGGSGQSAVQNPQGGFRGYGPQNGTGGYGPSGYPGGAYGPSANSGQGMAWGPGNGFAGQDALGGSFRGTPGGGGLAQGAAHAADLSQRAVSAGARAAHKAVSLKLMALIAVALIVIASILYMVFIKSGTPEDTIEKMEHALNNLDQDELLECFDNQIQDMYSGALSVGGELAGIDLGGLSDLASGLGGFMSAAGLTPEFDLQIISIEYSDDNNCVAEVNFIMTYQGDTQSETQILPMTKDGREWVISASAF